MIIGERIRALREEKKLTRGDIMERTGLQRTYIWRVENGYTVPAVETLEKFARGLGVPIHRLFYAGKEPPPLVALNSEGGGLWGGSGDDKKTLKKFRHFLSKMDEEERSLLLYLAEEMARRNEEKK
jgi:transcriptional regulator with XRE-family HTH domain